uniref:Protein kinase domain-containing protein n=1 Tax=Parascaris univalens TaxID=6257 RepID=A0A915B3T9_PARUN
PTKAILCVICYEPCVTRSITTENCPQMCVHRWVIFPTNSSPTLPSGFPSKAIMSSQSCGKWGRYE